METSFTFTEALAAQLRAERAASQASLQSMADAAGIAPGSVARYLSGERDPAIGTVYRFTSVLDVTLDQLVQRATRRMDQHSTQDAA